MTPVKSSKVQLKEYGMFLIFDNELFVDLLTYFEHEKVLK